MWGYVKLRPVYDMLRWGYVWLGASPHTLWAGLLQVMGAATLLQSRGYEVLASQLRQAWGRVTNGQEWGYVRFCAGQRVIGRATKCQGRGYEVLGAGLRGDSLRTVTGQDYVVLGALLYQIRGVATLHQVRGQIRLWVGKHQGRVRSTLTQVQGYDVVRGDILDQGCGDVRLGVGLQGVGVPLYEVLVTNCFSFWTGLRYGQERGYWVLGAQLRQVRSGDALGYWRGYVKFNFEFTNLICLIFKLQFWLFMCY